jgi:hypothetical protein
MGRQGRGERKSRIDARAAGRLAGPPAIPLAFHAPLFYICAALLEAVNPPFAKPSQAEARMAARGRFPRPKPASIL